MLCNNVVLFVVVDGDSERWTIMIYTSKDDDDDDEKGGVWCLTVRGKTFVGGAKSLEHFYGSTSKYYHLVVFFETVTSQILPFWVCQSDIKFLFGPHFFFFLSHAVTPSYFLASSNRRSKKKKNDRFLSTHLLTRITRQAGGINQSWWILYFFSVVDESRLLFWNNRNWQWMTSLASSTAMMEMEILFFFFSFPA